MNIKKAIESNNIKFVKKYIKDGNDLNIPIIDQDFSPLTYIMLFERQNDYDKMINLLIDGGTNINVTYVTYNYRSLIHRAIKIKSLKYVKLLIKKGCDINLLCPYYITPFQEAINKLNGIGDDRSFKIVKYLIEMDCDLKFNKKSSQVDIGCYEDYIFNSDYFKNNREMVIKELNRSFRIRYVRISLLSLCTYIVKNSREMYEDRLNILNRDERKLIKN